MRFKVTFHKFLRKFHVIYLLLFKKIFLNKSFRKKIHSGVLKNYYWNFGPLSNNEFVLGNYESPLQVLLTEELKRGSVFFDIGAHHGFVSLVAAHLVGKTGKVYSFEPFPANYKELLCNIKLNNLNDRVIPFNNAVSNSNSTIRFSATMNDVVNTYITSSPVFIPQNTIEVEAVTIDSLVSKNMVIPPNFIKIDVEGAEYDVLEGAIETIKRYKPSIHLSTHDNHNPGITNKCLNLLESTGYVIVSRTRHKQGELMDEISLKHSA